MPKKLVSHRVKKVGNSLQKLTEEFTKLHGEGVQIGHFDEQGYHQSGYTYPELMAMHHWGFNPETGENFPERPLLDVLRDWNLNLNDPKIRRTIKAWGKREVSPASNLQLLKDLGIEMAKKEKAIFGNNFLLEPNHPSKQPSAPLVDTGELRDNVAYRNSITKTIEKP